MATEVNLSTYLEFAKEEGSESPLVKFCKRQCSDDEDASKRYHTKCNLIEKADLVNRTQMIIIATKEWIYTTKALKKTLETLHYTTITIKEYEKILSPKMIEKVEDHAFDHYKASKVINEYKNATMQIEGLEFKMIKECL